MSLASLLPLLAPLLDKLISHIPDPLARERAKAEAEATLLSLLGQQQQGQVEINKVEAASSKVFVAGWRPFIGWVCGAALAYTYVLAPFLGWALTMWSPATPLPTPPTDALFELVLAMLGLGGLRTFEKIKRVS
jgi:hypothetical protein